jgi:hypothetical protein
MSLLLITNALNLMMRTTIETEVETTDIRLMIETETETEIGSSRGTLTTRKSGSGSLTGLLATKARRMRTSGQPGCSAKSSESSAGRSASASCG